MTETNRKKVVLVCMVDSIHVARWLSQFNSSEIDFILFPSTPNRRVHAKITGMIQDNGNISIAPFRGWLSIPLWGLDLIFRDYVRGLLLRRIIRRVKPDFVHALELQNAGYITSRALEDSSIKTTFIATNYGSDIYWFQQFPRHLSRIKKLLVRANRYSAECHRDVELARKYGFTGEIMPVFPNAGGFTEEQLNRTLTPTSERKVVVIKGYDGWVGRASVVVRSLFLLTDSLADYKIVFYSCSPKTIRLIKKLRRSTQLNVEWHAKGQLTHAQMLDLFSISRLYIGISLSDGISTSLLEAMCMGTFPIQTHTACTSEWFEDPISGIAISTISPDSLAVTIRESIGNSVKLDRAQRINREKISHLASAIKAREVVDSIYKVSLKLPTQP